MDLGKLLHKEKSYDLGVTIPCKRYRGCSQIASYKPQTRWFSSQTLYCLDEPDYFCVCLTKTKNGEEKTPERFLVIKVDREIFDEAKIATILGEIRKSKISEKAIKKIEHGKIRSVEELKKAMKKETEKISQKLKPILSGEEYQSYILCSNFKGDFGEILPFTPENFEELRAIGREYRDLRSKSIEKYNQ